MFVERPPLWEERGPQYSRSRIGERRNRYAAPYLQSAVRGTYSYGVYNSSSLLTMIRSSSINGTDYSIFNGAGSTALVADTMLDGAVSGPSFPCLNTYTEAFVALGSVCQVLIVLP